MYKDKSHPQKDHNMLDGRNEQEQIRAIKNLEQLQILIYNI